MAKTASIPLDTREYPDYVYRPYPRWIGRDEFGQDLIASSEKEVLELEERRVYPKTIGLDARGKVVQVVHPDEEQTKKTQVVGPVQRASEPTAPHTVERVPEQAQAVDLPSVLSKKLK
jgi:hypothetical protein